MEEILAGQDRAVFICGIARNQDEMLDLFDRVFLLHIDGATQQARLDCHDALHPPGRSEAGRREILDARCFLAVFARAWRAGARLPIAAATIATCNPASVHQGQAPGRGPRCGRAQLGQDAAAITTYWSAVSSKSVPTSRNPASSSRSRSSPSLTGRSEIRYSCGSIRSLFSKRNTMWATCS